jgi:hypothetical protein
MHEVLWDKDTMGFVACNKGTMKMLQGATKSWRSSKRHEFATYLLSLILAIECLGCDFAGWGTRYPESKAKADEILDKFFINNHTRLLDIFMPGRAKLDQNEIREAFGPKG